MVLVIVLVLCAGAMPQAAQSAVGDGVYGFGQGSELGLGDTRNTETPMRIEGLDNVRVVETRYHQSLVLLANGDVYSFGYNNWGQLGHGDKEDRNRPTKIQGIGRAKAIAAGERHSLIVVENGNVYSFGSNHYGQLGHGDREERLTPTRIEDLSNAKSAAAGLNHSLVLLENGDVYSFGYSTNGQLGLGEVSWPERDRRTPVRIFEGAEAIAAATNASLILRPNGDVYTFGENFYGQLGHGDNDDRHSPTKIEGIGPAQVVAGGDNYSLILLRNGDLYSFGEGHSGQLGHGDNQHRNSPTKVATLSEVSMIAAGARHSLAALEEGRVYSFGVGSNGRLGHGDQSSKNTPTLIEALPQCDVLGLAAGYHHSLVLVSEYPIIINVGDTPIQTTVSPIMRNVTPMVPVRSVIEAMGIQVEHSEETPGVLHAISNEGDSVIAIQLQDNSSVAKVGDKEIELEVPATLVDDHWLVPASFFSELLGEDVEWSLRTRIVDIPILEPNDNFIVSGRFGKSSPKL